MDDNSPTATTGGSISDRYCCAICIIIGFLTCRLQAKRYKNNNYIFHDPGFTSLTAKYLQKMHQIKARSPFKLVESTTFAGA